MVGQEVPVNFQIVISNFRFLGVGPYMLKQKSLAEGTF